MDKAWHSTFMWTGGAAGARKPDPVAMRLVHKKYTLSQYTLLKNVYAYPVAYPVAGAQIAACHKNCRL